MIDALAQQLHTILDSLARVDVRWFAPALALQLGNLCCRSIAWRNVLASAFPAQRICAWHVGRAYAIGVGLNGWLPARGGDAAKVALVRAQHPDTNAVAIATSCSVVVAFDALVGLGMIVAAWSSGAVAMPSTGALVERVLSSTVVLVTIAFGCIVVAVAAVRIIGPRARSGIAHARQGIAVVAAPVRWARTVLGYQALAWMCRIGVIFCMLCAFGIAATPQLAALVVVVGGMSTLVPVPGGAGSQQALAVFALASIAPASQAIAFSVGMQVGVTAVNTTIAIIAAMLTFGHLHPLRAVRAAVAASAHAGMPVTELEPVPELAA